MSSAGWPAAALLIVATPLSAQTMDPAMPGMAMPGMPMLAAKTKAAVKPDAGQRGPERAAPPPQAGHDMAAMPGMAMPEHGTAGTAQPAGNAPAPAPPTDHYADRSFPAGDMARARSDLYKEHGGGSFHQIMFNLAEYQARKGGDGVRWDAEAWFGGDINRLVLKTEGEGAFRGGVDRAEVQALLSRGIDPYWNLQAGIRHDLKPSPSRTYATIGIEGLTPYWFEAAGALFLSDKGDLLARAEGYWDQRLTQRLILQPRIELNFAARAVPATRIGSGLSNAELGLRLRYEIRREFAPYVGLSYDKAVGDTARYARLDGRNVGAKRLVFGVRTWF